MPLSDVRIGTADGLFDGAGNRIGLDGRRVVAMDETWLVVDNAEIWASDPLQLRATWDGPHLQCGSGGFFGTAEAGLVQLRESELVRVEAFDEVESRADWFTPWGGPPDTRSITTDDAGRMFVNVHVGATCRSDDRGLAFAPTTLAIGTDVHEIVATGDWLLAAAAVGLAWSRDSGNTWTIDTAGLHSTYLRSATRSGDWLLVSAADGPDAAHGAIYRRSVHGGAFTKCAGGLPEWLETHIDTACMAASEATVVAACADGTLWRSDDAGVTWVATAEGLPRPYCVALH